MQVFIEKTGQKKRIAFSGKASGLLSALKINPETVIIVKNDEVVTDDEQLSESDEIRLLSIISGG
ncbi:MoaD/ThiS family protein [Candidatus Woesearchaeota archaeon]|nr:MoaD/ThiS family protein [Candidatus Woesearchaeota archaeon]